MWAKLHGFFVSGPFSVAASIRPRRWQPATRIVLSFAALIVVGAGLLSLPLSVADGQAGLPWHDAFFTSTSAVCVTGLSPVDVGVRLSGFGQAVLLLLIQAGGLGFITLSTGLLLSLGVRSSLAGRCALAESFAATHWQRLSTLLRLVLATTFTIELIGAALLASAFHEHPGLPWPQALWFGLFHSISAFCNAGFSLFSAAVPGHPGNGLEGFRGHALVNLTVCALIVLGGIGFLVLDDLVQFVRTRGESRLTLHTRIVLAVSLFLIVAGAGAFLLLEWSNPRTLGPLRWYEAIWPSLFQSVTARTAGFNTLALNTVTSPGLLLLLILMFIGGSPASCAGGVKTTTAFVLFSVAAARLSRRRQPVVFNREVGAETVARAATLVLLSGFFVTVAAGLIMAADARPELARCEGGVFLDLLFETVSGFGTVGLSTGVTPALSVGSKLILVLVMFVGRVGPLTLFATLAQPPHRDRVRFPDEPVVVG